MSYRIVAVAVLSAWLAGCATAHEPTRLTVGALEEAAAACRVPDARVATDHHVSIVLHGDSPDRPRQKHCLTERLRRSGYWWDQIVTERASGSDL